MAGQQPRDDWLNSAFLERPNPLESSTPSIPPAAIPSSRLRATRSRRPASNQGMVYFGLKTADSRPLPARLPHP